MSGPWREVRDDVRLYTGPKGGRYWYVTLVPCGHTKAVPIPPLREYQIAMVSRRLGLSPRRARCLLCPADASRSVREKNRRARHRRT